MTETKAPYVAGYTSTLVPLSNADEKPDTYVRWHLTVNGMTARGERSESIYHITLAALLFDLHERLEAQMHGETVVYKVKRK